MKEIQESEKAVRIYNRATGKIEKERIAGEHALNWLYGTRTGRFFTNIIFKKSAISKWYGQFENSAYSRYQIKKFINDFAIDTTEFESPIESFKSFNEFFTRKLKPDCRPIDSLPGVFIAPADSRFSVQEIKTDTTLPIKGKSYSISQLLRDSALASQFYDGLALVFRLAPVDYHRFCYCDDGAHGPIIRIDGSLHSVNPVALASNLPVFEENYREYCIFHTKQFDDIAIVEVGAMMVGKIVQHNPDGATCFKGQEKGYFEFGGSTIIILVQKNILRIDADIQIKSYQGIETLVRYGSRVGSLH